MIFNFYIFICTSNSAKIKLSSNPISTVSSIQGAHKKNSPIQCFFARSVIHLIPKIFLMKLYQNFIIIIIHWHFSQQMHDIGQ
jgi:hypothetical protein